MRVRGARRRGVGVLVVGAGVLLLVVLASAGGSVRPFEPDKNQWSLEPRSPPSTTAGVQRPEAYGDPGPWWGFFWSGLLYLAIAVIMLVLLRIIFQVATAPREERQQKQPPTKAERLAEAVDRGIRAVERGTPADAVIACWVGLEDAAAAAGVARTAAETPAEFTVRVLAVDGVSATDLATLADLYREARYSSHPSTEQSRAKARAALIRLHADLTASRAGRRRSPR